MTSLPRNDPGSVSGSWTKWGSDAPNRKHTAEEIITTGNTVAWAARRVGVSEQIFYRWQAEYGSLRVVRARRPKQLGTEKSRLKRAMADSTWTTRSSRRLGGKLLSRARRRRCVQHVRSVPAVSERRTCKVSAQPRPTQRRDPLVRDDERALTRALTNDIVGLATRSGR